MSVSDREPRTSQVRVDTIKIVAFCPECGDELVRLGLELPTDPPQYQYKCSDSNYCDYKTTSFERWPRIEYREIVH
jgi:hypothetical protein